MSLTKTLLAATLIATSASVSATVVLPGNETSLQEVFNNITVGGNSSVNVDTDQSSQDQVWTNTDSGVSPALFVIEIAGNASTNTFGIYDENSTGSYIELFSGADTSGDQATFSILDDGSVLVNHATALSNGYDTAAVIASLTAGDLQYDTGINFSTGNFGFYLGTGAGTPTFYSIEDDNQNGEDQMVAYQGQGDDIVVDGQTTTWTNGGWILAFEDIAYSNSDKDFNDLVVFVESTQPVSEPGTVALFGLGLVGLGMARRKQNKKA